jgi:hypothetical protein
MKFDPRLLAVPRRPHYFSGQLLTADDLAAEQDYHRQMRWLHNRMLHGWGVVGGLHVQVEGDDAGHVVVSPGFALDGWGRELIIIEPVHVGLPGKAFDVVLYLQYVEEPPPGPPGASTAASDTPLSPPAHSGTEPAGAPRTAHVLVELPPEDRAISPSRRADYAIPFARVRRVGQRWQLDVKFRPPRVRS